MNKRFIQSLSGSVFCALLAACGASDEGGVSSVDTAQSSNDTIVSSTPDEATSESTTTKEVAVVTSLFVTDSTEAPKTEVWVNLLQVDAIGADGAVTTLFASLEGEAINLRERNDVGQLIAVDELAAGEYTGLAVTTSSEIQFISDEGEVTTEYFELGATQVTFDVPTELTVVEGEPATIFVDFSARSLQVSEETGVIEPVIRARSKHDGERPKKMRAHSGGSVVEVLSATSFTVAAHGNEERLITVTLDADANVTDVTTGEEATDTSLLAADLLVRVAGDFDPETQSVLASSVIVNPTPREKGDKKDRRARRDLDDGMTAVAGEIVSFDGSALVVDIVESDFMPDVDVLDVANAANARVCHGSLESLEAGQTIKMYGEWDGVTYSAAVIKVDGLKPEGHHDRHDQPSRHRDEDSDHSKRPGADHDRGESRGERGERPEMPEGGEAPAPAPMPEVEAPAEA